LYKTKKTPTEKGPSSENTSIRRWVLPAARDIERHIHKAPKSVETDSGKRDSEVHFANNTVRQIDAFGNQSHVQANPQIHSRNGGKNNTTTLKSAD
jgi:hypothetical protein